MTNRQAGICRNVLKYKNLNVILQKSRISDYEEIQDILGPRNLDFSDCEMDDNTEISLTDNLIEELEKRRRIAVDVWFTRIIAIAAFIISVIALLGQLGILGLQQS